MTLGRTGHVGRDSGARLRILLSAALLVATLSVLVPPSVVLAAGQVTSLADDGSAGTLRSVMAGATAGDTIAFAPDVTGTIVLTQGQLDVNRDLIIDGPGADVLAVSGNGASRVFKISGGVSVGIDGLTITEGRAGDGGGIYNSGELTLANSTVSVNYAIYKDDYNNYFGDGGGIYNSGTLLLMYSTISGNSTVVSGGGIYNTGTLDIISSGLSGNSARYGGGITNSGTTAFNNSALSGNQALNGGGISNTDTGVMDLMASILSGNSARYGGGIINSGTLTLTNSTLSVNSAVVDGGGIYNAGTATFTYSTVSGNVAESSGGGIYNFRNGVMTLTNSTLSGNSAMYGGGIYNYYLSGYQNDGTLTLTNSTVSGNSASSYGGGIHNAGGMTTLTNSTLSGNSAGSGGGISNYGNGVMTLTNSTLSGNSATYGGGIYNNAGTLTLSGTILANPGSNCYGSVTDNGYNLASDSTCAFSTATSTSSTHPRLDPDGLKNNGGPTQTIGLVEGSPAIDAIPIDACVDATGITLTTDQRGEPRPNGDACDIGAFEGSVAAVPDTTAPVVTVPEDQTLEATRSSGTVYTYTASAQDAVDGTVSTSCSRASGSTFPLGRTTVTCSATDAAGNTGSDSFIVTVRDTTAPVVRNLKIVAMNGKALNGTMLVRLTWQGSDNVGVTGYRLQTQTDGGVWVSRYVPGAATSKVLQITAGHSLRMRVRPVDAAGNLGTWKMSAPFATSVIEAHDTAAVQYTGFWQNGTVLNSIDGLTKTSTRKDASATFTFEGTSISLVSARSPWRGKATVSIDGVSVGTIDLYQATQGAPSVVFTRAGLSSTTRHTMTITVLGTKHPDSKGTTVVIDHVIVADATP